MGNNTEDYEIFEGHNKATSDAFEDWASKFYDDHRFFCHFTLMEIDNDAEELYFACKHCGHTVDADGIKVEV